MADETGERRIAGRGKMADETGERSMLPEYVNYELMSLMKIFTRVEYVLLTFHEIHDGADDKEANHRSLLRFGWNLRSCRPSKAPVSLNMTTAVQAANNIRVDMPLLIKLFSGCPNTRRKQIEYDGDEKYPDPRKRPSILHLSCSRRGGNVSLVFTLSIRH